VKKKTIQEVGYVAASEIVFKEKIGYERKTSFSRLWPLKIRDKGTYRRKNPIT